MRKVMVTGIVGILLMSVFTVFIPVETFNASGSAIILVEGGEEKIHNMVVNATPTSSYAGDPTLYDITIHLTNGGDPQEAGLTLALLDESSNAVTGIDENSFPITGDHYIEDREIILSGGTYQLYAYNDTHDSQGHNATITINKYLVESSPSELIQYVDMNVDVSFQVTPMGNGTLTIYNMSANSSCSIIGQSYDIVIVNGVGTLNGASATNIGNLTFEYTPYDGGESRYANGQLPIIQSPESGPGGDGDDAEQPVVVIEYPENGTIFNEPDIIVTGYATDNVGIVIVGFDHDWSGQGSGGGGPLVEPLLNWSFSQNITLRPGYNTITVSVYDNTSNRGSDSVTVIYEPNEESEENNSNNTIVCGYIKDEITGDPIENADVDLYWLNLSNLYLNSSTLADSNGFYSFNIETIEEKNVAIVANANGYYIMPSDVHEIIEGDTLWINLTLTPSAVFENSTIHGYINDLITNDPIENAIIVFIYDMENLSNPNFNITSSDSNGFYSINVPAGNILASINADGYNPKHIDSIEIGENETLWVNFSLDLLPKENSVVCGYITDKITGEPIEDAYVEIDWNDEQWNHHCNNTYTNSNGFYSMNIAAGEIDVDACAGGYYSYHSSYYEYTIGENETLYVNITLEPRPPENSIVCGYITNQETGQPIENADVNLNWQDNQGHHDWNYTYTDSNGFYSMNIAAGEAFIYLFERGYFNKQIDKYSIEENETLWINISLIPSKVTGLTVTDAKDGKLDLSWNPIIGNISIDHYRIYRDGSFLTTVTTTSYQDTGLLNGHSYSYQIQVVTISYEWEDRSDPVSGNPTESGNNDNNNNNNDIQITNDDNNAPNAVAGGPYEGMINKEITFDGSRSSDPDNDDALSYSWSFGDGNDGTGVNPTHTFASVGNFTIKLTVTDDKGKTDIDTTYAIINKKPGNIKENPSENDNVTDPDNITGNCSENIRYIDDFGYLIDSNNDGVYDSFFNNATGEETPVESQEDGTSYKINQDGDEGWDYIYDIITGEIESITKGEGEKTEKASISWIMILLGSVSTLITMIAIVIYYNIKKRSR